MQRLGVAVVTAGAVLGLHRRCRRPLLMDPGGLIWSMGSEEGATDVRPHLLDLDEFL